MQIRINKMRYDYIICSMTGKAQLQKKRQRPDEVAVSFGFGRNFAAGAYISSSARMTPMTLPKQRVSLSMGIGSYFVLSEMSSFVPRCLT